MQLYVNPADELPIYRQIVRQVTDAIAGGRLRAGDKLPSHRDLALRLVIAPLTVKKAYDELEAEGLIDSLRGRGTFVSERAEAGDPRERRERLRDAAQRLLSQAVATGVPLSEVVDLLREIEKGMRP